MVSRSRRVLDEAVDYKELSDGKEAHWEVVQRLLFLYSKLNPGVKYVQVRQYSLLTYTFSGSREKRLRSRCDVINQPRLPKLDAYFQGMNEIIGPIYYVFATDPDPEWAAYAEADAFFCFQNLLSEIKDYFIKTLDSSTVGIGLFLFSQIQFYIFDRLSFTTVFQFQV